MRRPSVYLAGPIAGETYDTAVQWRDVVKQKLDEVGIDGFSPMRGKQYLRDKSKLHSFGYNEHILSTQRAIMARDFNDVKSRDLLIVNLLGTQSVSIGTVMEVAWAFAMQKIVIVVMEENNNLHDHAMMREAFSYRVTDLDSAVAVAQSVLMP